MATVTVDSYAETSSAGASVKLYGGWYLRTGQSITGYPTTFASCKFYLKKFGSPTGNAYATLREITGTFGTNAYPTGSVLATSADLDISTVNGTEHALKTFTFSTPPGIGFGFYAVELVVPGATTDSTTYILVNRNKIPTPDSHTHDGNSFVFSTTADYAYQTGGNDTVFYAYGSDAGRDDPALRSYNIVTQVKPKSTRDILRAANPMIKASAQAMRNKVLERARIQKMEAIRNQRFIKKLKK